MRHLVDTSGLKRLGPKEVRAAGCRICDLEIGYAARLSGCADPTALWVMLEVSYVGVREAVDSAAQIYAKRVNLVIEGVNLSEEFAI